MIAITGMGIVSPYGTGTDAFQNGFTRYQALHPATHFASENYALSRVGCVQDFIPKKYIPPMKARRMSRFSQLSLIASHEAWNMSGLTVCTDTAKKYGIIVGTGLGSVRSTDSFYEGLIRRGPLETNPILFPETVQNIAAAHISIELGIEGQNTTFSQGDISGEFALYYAARLLRKRQADAILVCGADELTEPLVTGMKSLRLLSSSNVLAPFDRKRDGIVPAEGAASLVLERTEDAERRGVNILGHIKAFGLGSDSIDRFSYARSESMIYTIDSAVRKADIAPDLISASANSTVELDRRETVAIKSVFGDGVPVTALKSQTGSFMASGVMKVASALITIREGLIPPIFGLEDPEINGIGYITDKPVKKKINSCLINGFSHGGSNMCIVVTGNRRAKEC